MRDLIRRLSRLDRAGLALVGMWIMWATTTSLIHGRCLSPLSPYLVAPLMVALGVGLGRRLATRSGDPRIDVSLVVLTSWFFLWELWRGGPGGGPLGYANANAALAVQVLALTGLAALVRDRSRDGWLRLLLVGGMVAVIVDIASRAGLAVALPVLVVVLLVLVVCIRRRWWSIAGLLIGAIALTGAAVGNVWLARMSSWNEWANAAFDPARHALWSDAFALWQQHRVIGAGPGAFQQYSALAPDPDTDTAHSSVLQVAAETGVVGVALFAALAAMGYAIAMQGHPRRALIGIAAWSALGIHSFVDHLLEFWPVVLSAGLVLGWAGARSSEEFDVSQGEGPVAGRWRR